VRRFDRRWSADQAERERHEAAVASRLPDRQPQRDDQPDSPETTALVIRKTQP
jgi:hypothetical protein